MDSLVCATLSSDQVERQTKQAGLSAQLERVDMIDSAVLLAAIWSNLAQSQAESNCKSGSKLGVGTESCN